MRLSRDEVSKNYIRIKQIKPLDKPGMRLEVTEVSEELQNDFIDLNLCMIKGLGKKFHV